jgi:hypothetical protein
MFMKMLLKHAVAAARIAAGQPSVVPSGQPSVVPTVCDRRQHIIPPALRRSGQNNLWKRTHGAKTAAIRLFFVFLAFFCGQFVCHAQVQQAWVASYNNDIPSGTNQAVKMALDPAGNIYITGFSQNTNGNLDYATIKYAPNGSQVWAARFDSTNNTNAIPAAIALDTSNNVILTGSALTVKYDTNGNQLWTAPYVGNSVGADSSNNVFVAGFATNLGVVKLNPNGSNVWTMMHSAGVVLTNFSQALCVDSTGNSYVASYNLIDGTEEPTCFGTVTKYDPNGTVIWFEQYQNGEWRLPYVRSTALDTSANLYLLLSGYSRFFVANTGEIRVGI